MTTSTDIQPANEQTLTVTNAPIIQPLQRGAMTETLTRITIMPSDMLMFAAVAMLPFDGTKIGIAFPYWTPISPGCSLCMPLSTGVACAIRHVASYRFSSFHCCP